MVFTLLKSGIEINCELIRVNFELKSVAHTVEMQIWFAEKVIRSNGTLNIHHKSELTWPKTGFEEVFQFDQHLAPAAPTGQKIPALVEVVKVNVVKHGFKLARLL